MSFVHDDPEFAALLTQVSAETGIAYWITHSLWALHETELAIWFKGGTSLSKGFGIIERFSEDLDLIERGGVTSLPEVMNWASTNKGPTELPALVELDAHRAVGSNPHRLARTCRCRRCTRAPKNDLLGSIS